MTDSMKFGPEWLRNMSADNTNSSLLSGGGSSSGGTSLSSSGSVMSSSSNSNNGGNVGGHPSFGLISNVSSPTTVASVYALAPRNTFPEFRYGREEMLSLFDKHCNMPEILPTFKTIFIEKVQLPLALTPSTDEELLPQVPSVPTQRPSWMQRSPVGFNSSSRGTGRGGSVDRGRMRGKSTFHQIYQRPTAMFGDDDLRPVPLKTDRGWPERNGAGDSLNAGGGGIAVNSEWNGTPTSSPRKEFSNHPRNMENWRRNRNEDGSGDAPASGLGSADGWRGGSGSIPNSFGGTHRWGRSTSWRDDDISAGNAADVGYGSTGGGSLVMQRSYSTITTVNERGGYMGSSNGNNLTKTTINPSYAANNNQASSRAFNSLSSSNAPPGRINQWNTNSSGIVSSTGGGGDGEDNLPEWAMENPSDGGGTFDASGAFHGSVDEDESERSGKPSHKTSNSSSENSSDMSDSRRGKKSADNSTSIITAGESCHNKSSVSDSSEDSTASTPLENNVDLSKDQKIQSSTNLSTVDGGKNEIVEISENTRTDTIDTGKAISTQPLETVGLQSRSDKNIDVTTTSEVSLQTVSYYNDVSNSIAKSSTTTTDSSSKVHRDLSDRMREVADDMIEKLIMDDDTIGISDNNRCTEVKSDASVSSVPVSIAIPTTAGNNVRATNAFVTPTVAALLKQSSQLQTVQGSISASPTLTPTLSDGTVHKGIQLYGGGVVVDHATMQHHHLQQQQQLAAATVGRLPHAINTTLTASPTDLWYYRDPQSKVQGPFTAIEMTEWYRAGYFNENLYVRRLCDTHFRSLGELIKICNDNMPFTHSHLIPNLDNMHLSNSAAASSRQPQKSQIIGDYGLKQPNHQQSEQREQLKSNLNSGTDFLSSSVKNLMNPVDVSNMYFQMLRHQELLIFNELSKNECFQRLTPSEKEAVVRQKLPMHAEYLPSLSGLSSSLASINAATPANQLYDVMLDGIKKDHLFGSNLNTGTPNAPQQSQSNPFLDPDDFLLSSQQHQHQLQTVFSGSPYILPPGGENGSTGKVGRVNEDATGNELLTNFNMRMYLSTGNSNPPPLPNPKPQDFIGAPTSSDFLNEAPLLAASAAAGLVQNNSLVHSWLPPLASGSSIAQQPAPLMSIQQQSSTQSQNNQWPNNILVGIPMTVMQGSNNSTGNVNTLGQDMQQQQQNKSMPSSMWDLPTLEHGQGEQMQHQQHTESNSAIFDDHKPVTLQPIPSNEQQTNVVVSQAQHRKGPDTTEAEQVDTPTQRQQEPQAPHTADSTTAPAQITDTTKQRKEDALDKYQNGNNKRGIKQQSTGNKNAKGSDEISIGRKNEEERRREQAEDKRRQKEEKKRQQLEEEKRRQQQADEEKRRLILEEKERQQQIQAQRRQAMLGSNSNTSNSMINAVIPTSISKPTKELQQRVQSSIAPWSTQTNTAAAKSGPCLAEIQKAERRERRADQQRQIEMLEKQMRANAAAAAEANDSILKWNASPIPVKSFAEIQAEEAKRLASEQMEMQRRKEQEQQQTAAAVGGNNVAGLGQGVNSISAIWGGAKVWGSTSTTGFWEEPIKFSAAVAANNNLGTTAATVLGTNSGNNNSTNINSKQALAGQQKTQISTCSMGAAMANSGLSTSQQPNSAVRNLRKSQTVSIMQNTNTQNGKNAKNNQQQQQIIPKSSTTNKVQQQKSGGNNVDGATGGTSTDKKGISKNQTNNEPSGTSNNKRDDYENEFITWCTKSLNNMNTKLDVPTFVTFLRDLESPYEVKDYIRMYLGESKDSTEFSKQFLERRSKYKNLQRAQNAHNDDMCKPAPAITPSGNDNSDNKGKQKKVKKNKMTKLDARILGFSVTAAEGRTNVGDRAYVDAP